MQPPFSVRSQRSILARVYASSASSAMTRLSKTVVALKRNVDIDTALPASKHTSIPSLRPSLCSHPSAVNARLVRTILGLLFPLRTPICWADMLARSENIKSQHRTDYTVPTHIALPFSETHSLGTQHIVRIVAPRSAKSAKTLLIRPLVNATRDPDVHGQKISTSLISLDNNDGRDASDAPGW
jgi:hypothetical protein